ncbi:winged helix-turn-helix domain-containing protein [Brevibacterium otitidis]|uniref:Winged helix-turn-helix domain-containing protein n=1 Tax=Brevibacterium otitidis TaxID=53364 RepID=A0ABV5X5W9_9MICO|nr:crosslink repair DNA glycosylase YcaQ family protein [Brevibacterium otitidis]
MTVPKLSLEAARRCALAASGFSRPRPAAVNAGHLRRTFERLGVVQIDSVARVARAHYLPFFSRLGPYDTARLDALFNSAPRMGVEYWSHEAAYAPVEIVNSWHRQRAEWFRHDYGQRHRQTGAAFRQLMSDVEAALQAGPATARQLAERVDHAIPEQPKDHWGWNHSHVKRAAEALFRAGRISAAGRNQHFERIYALPAAVDARLVRPPLRFGPAGDPHLGADPDTGRIPRGITGISDELLTPIRTAARALGIGRLDCFADYYRSPRAATAEAVAVLVETGELVEVDVAGQRAYRWHEAPVPRRVEARALLAPFDPLVFNRQRISWLFGFDYRIEIYTPAHKRVYGYYVLPFLCGDRLVGRVDLAAERARGVLTVHAVHWEPGLDAGALADCWQALEAELEDMRRWLGLECVQLGAG